MKTGPKNLITDVAGLRVGNAQDETLKSGTTVLIGERPFTASVSIMGGSPGTRETDLLAPDKMVETIDALVLSGGSAFGLDAAAGVADRLRELGRGFQVGPVRVPIVPAAILFDLVNGGDKDWTENPYKALGRQALEAADGDFMLGSVGAGAGALTAGLKGGLGSASLRLDSGFTVGALVAANPRGSATMGQTAHFWASPFEVEGEFGGKGPRPDPLSFAETAPEKWDQLTGAGTNTTLAIVATDAVLTKPQAQRLATAAQDGIGRAISPAHAPVDGDLVFSVATGQFPLFDPVADQIALGHAAAICLSRAIARAVYEATPADGDLMPTWQQLWGAPAVSS